MNDDGWDAMREHLNGGGSIQPLFFFLFIFGGLAHIVISPFEEETSYTLGFVFLVVGLLWRAHYNREA